MVTLVEQELLTLTEYLSSSRVFVAVRVAHEQSSIFYAVLCRPLFVFL